MQTQVAALGKKKKRKIRAQGFRLKEGKKNKNLRKTEKGGLTETNRLKTSRLNQDLKVQRE